MSVYFAQSGPYTKIGYSADPVARSGTITISGKRPADLARGAEVQLLGWIPGSQWREIEMHVRFADRRVRGEWFVIDTAEVRDLIWSDPRGVDLERMSAQAVFVALHRPETTRDEMTEAGIRVEAAPLNEVLALIDSELGSAIAQAGAA